MIKAERREKVSEPMKHVYKFESLPIIVFAHLIYKRKIYLFFIGVVGDGPNLKPFTAPFCPVSLIISCNIRDKKQMIKQQKNNRRSEKKNK